MNAATDNITDLHEHTLIRIAEEMRAIRAQKDAAPLKLGECLIRARALFSDNIGFGGWLKSQHFGIAADTLYKYRQAAEFVHEHVRERLPTDWLVIYQASCLPEAKHSEVREAWRKGECLTRKAFTERFPAPKRAVTHKKASAKTVKAIEELTADMPMSQKQNFDNALATVTKLRRDELQAEYTAEVVAKVEERLKDLRAQLEEELAAARLERLRYEGLNTKFHTILTLDQFKLVRSCLHPDRTDIQKSKLNEAFAIFNRLEKCVNKNLPIAELRRTGWETLSPFYKKK